MTKTFASLASLPTLPLWTGILARVVGGRHLTFAVVELEPFAQAKLHQHANEQIGIVLQGALHFAIGSEARDLGPGDTYLIPPDVPHEATAGADGAVVIDVFSPPRADWHRVEAQAPSAPRWP